MVSLISLIGKIFKKIKLKMKIKKNDKNLKDDNRSGKNEREVTDARSY